MVIIIGENNVSLKLQTAAKDRGTDCLVVKTPDQISDACELVILNTDSNVEDRRKEIAAVLEKTTAPVAVRVRLEYVCSYCRDIDLPGRIVGIRTMEEDFIGQYIELVRTFDTDDDVCEKAKEVLARFNDRVACIPDVRGGIFYRILPVTANTGAFLISEGVVTEDIDKTMRYGGNFKRPPLEAADELGLDLYLDVLTDIYQETGRPAYRPSPLLKQMVNAGRLGKKSGRGFYEYR